ncbi:hypothetical protein [Spirosoma fluminis]
MSEQEYIDYFRNLATKHTAIQHSETNNRFYVASDNNRTSLDQAVRKKLKLPAVVIDQYLDDLDRTSDNYRLKIYGGVSVLVTCNGKDPDDVRRAQAEARIIALSFVNRMYRDCRHPQGLLVNKRIIPSTEFEGEPAQTIAEIAAGWGYPFEWTMPTTVAVSADDWLDL